jgi:hypothetical protein
MKAVKRAGRFQAAPCAVWAVDGAGLYPERLLSAIDAPIRKL